MATDRELKIFFNEALKRVIERGWNHEIEYFRKLSFSEVDGIFFFREYAFCVYAAGFSNYVLNTKWEGLGIAYKNWNYDIVCQNKNTVRLEALNLINHNKKTEAILECAQLLHDNGWHFFKNLLLETKLLLKLHQMKYIGEAGRYHLARNLGADVAKPDRYMLEYAYTYGYPQTGEGVQQLAERIAGLVSERPGVIDYVLWRDHEGRDYTGSIRSKYMKIQK